MAFATWFIDQAERHDWVGLLAFQAKRDPRFPRGGSADEVRSHLEKQGADGDVLAALEDAEREWACA